MKVKDVFELSSKMKNLKLLAGSKGLDKDIKDIGVLEVPDGILWSRKDELVITTGYFIFKKEIELIDIIKILKEKDAVGLGIKTDRFIKNMPEKAIELANELEFPLFEIPIYLGYNDFIWPIISNLLSEEDYINYRLMKFNDAIHDVSRKNYNIGKIVETLSEHIEHSFFVLSADKYDIKGQSKGNGKISVKEIIKIISDNKEKIMEYNKCFFHNKKEYKVWIYPLKTVEDDIGYLCIVSLHDSYISDIEFKIINQTIPYLIISMMNEVANYDILYDSLEDFLKNIIFSKNITKLKLKEGLRYFNIELNRQRSLWILSISGKKEKSGYISAEIMKFLKGKLPGTYVISKNNMIICIEDIACKTISRRIEFKQLLKELKYLYPKYKVVIGVSEIFDSLFEINLAYEEAKFCIQIGEKIDDSRIYFFKNLIIYNILYELLGHKHLIRIYKDTILKIKQHDLDTNSEFFYTLSKYIDNNYNVFKTSQELFIHRNTLYKRLKKIEEIIKMNLNDTDIQLILNLCSKFDNIYEE